MEGLSRKLSPGRAQQPQEGVRPSPGQGGTEAATAGYPWPWTGYSDEPADMPLGGYAALLIAYAAIFGSVLGATWSSRDAQAQPDIDDIVLFGIATHKIGRIITKDWVTSPLRAPFTTYSKSLGGGEVSEASRGTGVRRAIGDLLTCPWCIAPWVAGSLYSLFLVEPRLARLLAAGFTSVTLSDLLQHAYGFLAKRTAR